MVTCLSTLTRLETLSLEFRSHRSRPDRDNRRLPSRTRTIFPALTQLGFKGASEYLEDLAARLDAPQLRHFTIAFFYQLIFGTPQLSRFIGRSPKFQAYDEAHVIFCDFGVSITLPQTLGGVFQLRTACRQSDWQLSALEQLCTSSFPRALLRTVEHLSICESRRYSLRCWQDDFEDSQWLELLHPFTALKELCLSQDFAPRIAPALQGLSRESATEVLSALQSLCLGELHSSGPVHKAIGQFVAVRELSSLPTAISHWDRGEVKWWEHDI